MSAQVCGLVPEEVWITVIVNAFISMDTSANRAASISKIAIVNVRVSINESVNTNVITVDKVIAIIRKSVIAGVSKLT